MLLNDRNYYPYYMVGNFVTTSKFEALKKAHDKKINDVKFHFHDDLFSQQDWTIEPPESLEELYRQRAEQLRNQYDYLILGFQFDHLCYMKSKTPPLVNLQKSYSS